MNFANKISTFRILSVPFFVASIIYYCNYPEQAYFRIIALAIFIIAVISDGVDGYIARKSKQQSKAGLILDPLGDKLLLMSAFICLYYLPSDIKFPLWVTLVVISRDAIILLGVLIIFLIKQSMNIMPTKWGKLTTIFQMLAALSVLMQLGLAYILMYLAVAFTIISGIDYIMRGFKVLYGPDTSRNNH